MRPTLFGPILPYIRRALGFVVVGLIALGAAAPARGSDHADPIGLGRQEGGITDLFVFPAKDGRRRVDGKPVSSQDGDQLVVILCVRRSLTTSPPYPGLDAYRYSIFMDLRSAVRFDDEHDRKRYGGTVVNPEGIDANFAITLILNNDTTVREMEVKVKEGGAWAAKKEAGRIKPYSGVRDDPFIFPMFFGTNVIAVVIPIPLNHFPGQPTDFLIWAKSERYEKQIDHVGRSQRTQLPRFDLLNTVHPKDHVAELRKKDSDPGLVDDFLRTQIAPPFNLRPYDFKPDVMIYTRRREYPVGFPNGRLLEDDVAAQTCLQGDCQLYELSFAVKDPSKYAKSNGRPAENDKPFSDDFPYLAEPWPDREPTPPRELTAKNQMLVVVLVIAAAAIVLLPWVLYFRAVRRLRATRRQPAQVPSPRPAEPESGARP